MNKISIRTAAALLILALLQGCGKLYKEDMAECYEGVSVVMKVHPSTTGAAEAEAAVEHAVLYVFDGEGRFLERRETEVGKTELLTGHREAGPLTVIGWLNKCDVYGISDFGNNILRGDGLVSLGNPSTRVDLPPRHHPHPTDLFYGENNLENIRTSMEVEHKEIFASRLTGQANITVRGLKEYARMQDDDFYLIVGPTAGAVDFYGQHRHEQQAAHHPAAQFDQTGDFGTNNFTLMPTGENTPMTVQIWHEEAGLIYEADSDIAGTEFHIFADRTTNILIDFTVDISIEIQRTLWGVSFPWKTFN